VDTGEAVHLYITCGDGKEHSVLSGIANQKGEFERQHDQFGNPIGWFGDGATQLQSMLSSDSPAMQRRTLRGEDLAVLRRRMPQNEPLDCRIQF